jgi:hypothetical protein
MTPARNALGMLAGAVVWAVTFMLLTRLLYLAWPAYASAAQAYRLSGTYDFAPLLPGAGHPPLASVHGPGQITSAAASIYGLPPSRE